MVEFLVSISLGIVSLDHVLCDKIFLLILYKALYSDLLKRIQLHEADYAMDW